MVCRNALKDTVLTRLGMPLAFIGCRTNWSSDYREDPPPPPQGTVLGPLLFLIYIIDLPEKLNSSAMLFADDCLLCREVNTTSDTNKLQKDLDMLQEWETKWQIRWLLMQINVLS